MKRIILSLLTVLCLSSFTLDPFSVSGDKVAFRLNNSDLSPVKIYVSDGEGRVVFSETLKESEIGKVFNFEDAIPDIYYIVVVDGTTTYRKTLDVK